MALGGQRAVPLQGHLIHAVQGHPEGPTATHGDPYRVVLSSNSYRTHLHFLPKEGIYIDDDDGLVVVIVDDDDDDGNDDL